MGKFGGRDKIPETFSVGREMDFSQKKNELGKQHLLWTLTRYQKHHSVENECNVPTFTALKSLSSQSNFPITQCAFTPILPYPATEFDTFLQL